MIRPSLWRGPRSYPHGGGRPRRRPRPGLEPNGNMVNVLVSDPPPDSDLVNGWGLSRAPTSPWWVADNGTGKSTLYNASGAKQGLA